MKQFDKPDNVSPLQYYIHTCYILYIPVHISYVHPITVLIYTEEHINDMLIL